MANLRVIEGNGTAQRGRPQHPSSPSPTDALSEHYETLAQRVSQLVADQLTDQLPAMKWSRAAHNADTFSDSISAIVDEIGRLKANWAGPDSIPPSGTVLEDIQTVLSLLPLDTRTPRVEVDPSDGEVKLAWRCTREPKSISLALSGEHRLRVFQVHATDFSKDRFYEFVISAHRLTELGRKIQMLEFKELFVKE